MNEITPEQSETVVAEAAHGRASGLDPNVGAVLASMHAAGSPTSAVSAPTLATAGGAGLTSRIARRTAVAASVAVFSLAGVAAATTAGIELLDLGSTTPTLVEDEGDDAGASGGADDSDDSGESDGSAAAESDGGDDASADGAGFEAASHRDDGARPARFDEVEGVDPVDGLDDEELVLLCEAAVNHGHYVSSVARDKITETEGNHGSRVSEAAQSDCGRGDDADDADDADDDADDADDADDDGDDDDDADEDDDGEARRRGRGHDRSENGPGNGNGHGHGHGHSDD